MSKKPAQRKRQARKKRQNPANGKSLPPMFGDLSYIAGHAGTLAIQAALITCGATIEEKLLISAVIPMLLKVIRTATGGDLSGTLEKLFPEGVEVDLLSVKIQPEGTANEEPIQAEPHAGGKPQLQ